MEDTRQLLQHLLKHKVDCVLVGGYAAVIHGSPSVTKDLDICFNFNSDNVKLLLEALESVHPQVRSQTEWVPLSDYTPERLAQLDNLYLKTDLGQLDLLGFIAGIGHFEEVNKHVTIIPLFGIPCRVLDINSLIKSKETLNRPKDHQVIIELKTIKEALEDS